MRGLQPIEREILHRRATNAPTVRHYEGASVEAIGRLIHRGCLYVRTETDEAYVVNITPRGRLALQCDAAVRAVLA